MLSYSQHEKLVLSRSQSKFHGAGLARHHHSGVQRHQGGAGSTRAHVSTDGRSAAKGYSRKGHLGSTQRKHARDMSIRQQVNQSNAYSSTLKASSLPDKTSSLDAAFVCRKALRIESGHERERSRGSETRCGKHDACWMACIYWSTHICCFLGLQAAPQGCDGPRKRGIDREWYSARDGECNALGICGVGNFVCSRCVYEFARVRSLRWHT